MHWQQWKQNCRATYHLSLVLVYMCFAFKLICIIEYLVASFGGLICLVYCLFNSVSNNWIL